MVSPAIGYAAGAMGHLACHSDGPVRVHELADAIGAPPAVINAIVNALRHLGVTHVDMPATPQRLWSILQTAKKQAA